MDKDKLAKELFDAFYWHYRIEYGRVVDYIEEENNIHFSTKNAERYSEAKIKQLILELNKDEYRTI